MDFRNRNRGRETKRAETPVIDIQTVSALFYVSYPDLFSVIPRNGHHPVERFLGSPEYFGIDPDLEALILE